MKPTKPINRVSPKLKRGQPFIYNGQPVWVELEKNFGNVLVCINEERGLEHEYFEVKKSELEPINKARTSIQAKPKTLSKAEKEKKQSLNVFYASQILVCPSLCENCGQPLVLNSKWDYRKVTCHILGKADFKSVAIHPHNKVFMCCDFGCYGHAKWDNGNSDDRILMPVYKVALMRYNEFKEVLTDREYIRSLTYLKLDMQ